MSTFICPGYEGHLCGKTVERTNNRKRCRECSKEDKKARNITRSATWDAAHKEEAKAYRAEHKEEKKAYYAARKEEAKAYRAEHKEEWSVKNHYYWIFGTKKNPPKKNYESMPFEDAWNPKKGGSFRAGGEWIKANLGKRPEGCTLHVIPNGKGFVPENLVWSYPTKQVADQMHKIIARQRHQISQQSEYILSLEKRISELLGGVESTKEAA